MSTIHDLRICGVLLMTLCQLVHYSKGEYTCKCECIYESYSLPASRPAQCLKEKLPQATATSEEIELKYKLADCHLYDDYSVSVGSTPECDLNITCQILRDCCLIEDTYISPPNHTLFTYQSKCSGDFRIGGLPNKNCSCTSVSTTLKPSTIEQTTTSKPSTIEQSTRSKPSTSEQSTTSKPSIIEQTTTSKPSTIEQSTRSKPSTIELSTRSKPSSSEESTTSTNQPKSGFAIGLGVGFGICVCIAAHIALLVYCRLKDRGEGQGKAQGTLPKGTLPSTDTNRQSDNEEYAEIDSYVGDTTMRAVANQAYSSSDVVITPGQSNQAYTSLNDPAINSHQYKSLKKPNQDLGNEEYADPEKYTEPPFFPRRNSNVIDDVDDDDYVSHGTPEPATNNGDGKEYYALEPTALSSDYVNSSAQSNPKEPPTPSSDYVSVDTQDHLNSKSPSSHYVSVDAPDLPSPISPSSGYVSVDAPDHPSPISPSSDYVSVDSPAIGTEDNDNSSDYADFQRNYPLK